MLLQEGGRGGFNHSGEDSVIEAEEILTCYSAGFEDGGRVHESRHAIPEDGKGKERDFPLEPPERTLSC